MVVYHFQRRLGRHAVYDHQLHLPGHKAVVSGRSAGIVASGDANSGLERTFEAGDGVSLAVVDFGHLVHQPIWVARRSLASQVDMVSTMYVPLSVMRSTAAWST